MKTIKLLSNPKFYMIPPPQVTRPRRSNLIVATFNKGTHDKDNVGNLVDKNMITLRVRIHEMKMLEACNNPPSHWMDWEKKYYRHNGYNADVYVAIGVLQNFLMSVRPCLALGMVALIMLGVLFSSGVVLVGTIEIVKRLLYAGWVTMILSLK